MRIDSTILLCYMYMGSEKKLLADVQCSPAYPTTSQPLLGIHTLRLSLVVSTIDPDDELFLPMLVLMDSQGTWPRSSRPDENRSGVHCLRHVRLYHLHLRSPTRDQESQRDIRMPFSVVFFGAGTWLLSSTRNFNHLDNDQNLDLMNITIKCHGRWHD